MLIKLSESEIEEYIKSIYDRSPIKPKDISVVGKSIIIEFNICEFKPIVCKEDGVYIEIPDTAVPQIS